MFYPVESLKKGGRFHLCWVADSWPHRFNAITPRQLWSQDIRKLCDSLLEVMISESGRPSHRFSLRLSSQLLRGLVRLYQRKATNLLGDLCMINAHVFKGANKKFNVHDEDARPLRRLPQLPPAATVVTEEPENEQRVVELIQNSGNVVNNIQDITLKEAVIPDFQIPPNDNFGEENPEQQLQALLADRTIEMMMQETSAAQVSALDLPADKSADKSTDKSTEKPRDAPQMESIAEVDITFRKSTVEDIVQDFEKAVPEAPLPAPLPAPLAPIEPIPDQVHVPVAEVVQEEIPPPQVEAPQAPIEPQPANSEQEKRQPEEVDIELEELESAGVVERRRRRARRSLIVDKRTKLASNYLRARIDNPRVDMRCQDFTDAIIDIRVPADVLLHRPAHSGRRLYAALSPLLGGLYQRKLGHTHLSRAQTPEQQRDAEIIREMRTRSSQPTVQKIAEVEEPPIEAPLIPPADIDMTRRVTQDPGEITADILNITTGAMDITTGAIDVTGAKDTTAVASVDALNVLGDVSNVAVQDPNAQELDIADLPTQKLETLSQVARKRTSEKHDSPAKRLRSGGSVSFTRQQQRTVQPPEIIISEPDKENIPPHMQEAIARLDPPVQHSQVDAARMLVEAGLSDTLAHTNGHTQPKERDGRASEGDDETPLGSLDRTKVSLGDSVQTTDSQRFIRHHWGVEGTMRKILECVKRGGGALTLPRLLRAGPAPPAHSRHVAARCFSSLLKLKQHEFIRIAKDPETLEIKDISLGPRFDNL